MFIKWPEDENNIQLNEFNTGDNPYLVGYVWPEGKVMFPDFWRQSTKDWWSEEIKMHHATLNFDGYI